jgi:hypothetical protein
LVFQRRLERPAAVGVFEAVEDPVADRFAAGVEAARFLKFVAVGGARPVARLPLAADDRQPEILFDLPR